MLVVDLDNSLLRTDLLLEGYLDALAHRPWQALMALGALGQGRAALKARIAALSSLDVAELPVNEDVLAAIEAERQRGGRVALVSASDQRMVDAVAARFGCFDAAYGSDGRRNLKGAEKARFLVDLYGARGFDYVADGTADLEVWREARRAFTVGAGSGLRRRVEERGGDVTHLSPAPTLVAHLIALRPHQWLKNLLVFLPMLAAHKLTGQALGWAVLAFVTFSLTASSIYVINDLLDLRSDRVHDQKRHRPFASGAVPILNGVAMAAGMLLLVVVLCLAFGKPGLLGVLAIYAAATVAYSLYLKRVVIIDLCMLAAFYTLRLIAGAEAVRVPLSPWMLAFSCFLFLALAAVKRQSELAAASAAGREEQLAGRAWSPADLPVVEMFAVTSGYISVLVLALYSSSQKVARLYESPLLLWLMSPVLLYWISRLILLAHRGQLHHDPLVFAARDPVTWVCAALTVAFVLLGALT